MTKHAGWCLQTAQKRGTESNDEGLPFNLPARMQDLGRDRILVNKLGSTGVARHAGVVRVAHANLRRRGVRLVLIFGTIGQSGPKLGHADHLVSNGRAARRLG